MTYHKKRTFFEKQWENQNCIVFNLRIKCRRRINGKQFSALYVLWSVGTTPSLRYITISIILT